MTNENKNINELVSADDDPTAELEVLVPLLSADLDLYNEVDVKTYDASLQSRSDTFRGESISKLESDLRASEKINSRLQFDAEQLRSRLMGLESEIDAREDQTLRLGQELAATGKTVARKKALIKKRDLKIRSLKAEIRQREEEHNALITELRNQTGSSIESEEAPSETAEASGVRQPDMSADALRRLQRSEEYADTLRHQLQDLLEAANDSTAEQDYLRRSLREAAGEKLDFEATLQLSEARASELQTKLDAIKAQHEADIRLLRFELGEAQDTAVQSEGINSQLTSDLIVARGLHDDLQHSLSDAEENTRQEIFNLEKELKKLKRNTETLEQKLSTKNEAITVLLAEIAKRSSAAKAREQADEATPNADDSDTRKRNSSERSSRVLVGNIDGQVLRFPLFKDQLTIGRTDDNDIQLKAAHISRRHAVVQTDGDTTRIIDWGSKNGVFVNSEKISEHFLINGDVVTIGNARFRYEERKKRDL